MKHQMIGIRASLLHIKPKTLVNGGLARGAKRGIATGGHYVVPQSYNEPNVSGRVDARTIYATH